MPAPERWGQLLRRGPKYGFPPFQAQFPAGKPLVRGGLFWSTKCLRSWRGAWLPLLTVLLSIFAGGGRLGSVPGPPGAGISAAPIKGHHQGDCAEDPALTGDK